MISVIATLTIMLGKEADFEAAASALVSEVNAHEPDCLQYELCRSLSEPQTYIFMEKYKDKAAIEAHGKTKYFLAAQAPIGACLAGAPDIQSYTVLD